MSVNKYVGGKLLQLSGNADTRLTTEDIVNILGYTPADPDDIAETYTTSTYVNNTFALKTDFDNLVEDLTALTEEECDTIVTRT